MKYYSHEFAKRITSDQSQAEIGTDLEDTSSGCCCIVNTPNAICLDGYSNYFLSLNISRSMMKSHHVNSGFRSRKEYAFNG